MIFLAVHILMMVLPLALLFVMQCQSSRQRKWHGSYVTEEEELIPTSDDQLGDCSDHDDGTHFGN